MRVTEGPWNPMHIERSPDLSRRRSRDSRTHLQRPTDWRSGRKPQPTLWCGHGSIGRVLRPRGIPPAICIGLASQRPGDTTALDCCFHALPAVEAPSVEPGLTDALGGLSKNQRVAVVLIHGMDYSEREVADSAGDLPLVGADPRRSRSSADTKCIGGERRCHGLNPNCASTSMPASSASPWRTSLPRPRSRRIDSNRFAHAGASSRHGPRSGHSPSRSWVSADSRQRSS